MASVCQQMCCFRRLIEPVAIFFISRPPPHRYIGIMGEHPSAAPGKQIAEQRFLFLDKAFGEAVVTHGDRQVHSG